MNICKRLLVAAGIMLSACGLAHASDFPNKPVRIYVPYAAGGSTDIFIRMIAQGLSERWGQPVVVENRPAGNTVVASYDLTQAPADGHTMGVITSAFVINPGIRSNLPYNSLEDFSGLSYVLQIPNALVVHPSFPADTLDEFVEWAKSQDEPLLVASSGTGTLPYLLTLLAAERGEFEVEPITYNGSADAISNVLSGDVPIFVDAYSFLRPYIESGDLKLIGFFTEERLSDLPDVPVFQEKFPELSGSSKIGLKVRAGTPDEVREKISQDIREIVSATTVSQAILERGAYPLVSTPTETDEDLKVQVERWTTVANDAGIRLD